MRLLDRYLFRELLAPLAYCLTGIQALVIFFSLFGDLEKIQTSKLNFGETIEYSIMSGMDFLPIVLPISLLIALLITLSNHTRHNEITAMRAAGVGLWRLCAPYLIVGFAASVVLFWLNEWCVPRSTTRGEQILNRYVQKRSSLATQNEFRNFGFTNARDHRTWFITEYRVKTVEMLKPQVNWTLADGSSHRLYADRAIRTNGVWIFFNVAEYSQLDAGAPLLPSLQTNVLTMPAFDETPAEIRSEIKISSYQSFRNSRQADIPLRDILGYLRLHPNLPRADSSWLLTKLYGRLATPWTCLVVVFIAIPFGAASGRRNLFVGVAGSIFICFAYFVIQQVSLVLGAAGQMPAWLAAWLPNVVFGVTGLILTARVR